jgi:hypothetical protein
VVIVRAPGEAAFPGIVATEDATRMRVYDLSTRLPVLRTFAKGAAAIAPGGSWSHKEAVGIYTPADLESIAEYLRWVR